MFFFFFVNDTATTAIYTYLTHSFPTRRSSDLIGMPIIIEVRLDDTPGVVFRVIEIIDIGDRRAPDRRVLGGGRLDRFRIEIEFSCGRARGIHGDRKSTRLNSSH